MPSRIATFNVENMLEHPKALNLPGWSGGRAILNNSAKLTDITAQDTLSAADRRKLLEIMGDYPGLLTQGKSQ
jgi:hypothetical protein